MFEIKRVCDKSFVYNDNSFSVYTESGVLLQSDCDALFLRPVEARKVLLCVFDPQQIYELKRNGITPDILLYTDGFAFDKERFYIFLMAAEDLQRQKRIIDYCFCVGGKFAYFTQEEQQNERNFHMRIKEVVE